MSVVTAALIVAATGLHSGGAPVPEPAPAGGSGGFAIAMNRSAGFAVGLEDLLGGEAPAGSTRQTQSGSTATDLRARREAKRGNLAPPERGSMEAGLAWLEDGHWLQRIRLGWHGFLPTLGGFPSGSGQAFGLTWNKAGIGARYPNEFTPNRLDLTGSAAVSLRGYYLGLFHASLHRIGGSPFHVNFYVGAQRNAQEAFYGIGPDSELENRTAYRLDTLASGTVFWWQAPSWLYVGGGIGYRDYDADRASTDEFPGIGEIFDPADIPGFDEQVDFLVYDGFVQIDWRNRGNPYRGGLYALRFSRWDDRDLGEFDYNDIDVELQQYFPFLSNKRVIALRARTILTDSKAGQGVPFYLLPKIGGNRDLRGFDYSRFTDQNLVLLSAEYRIEVWIAMDLAFFVDAGKVFSERSDLDLNDLETDYGVGLRIKTTQSTFLRSDFALGGETFQWSITFDNSFDTLPIFSRILQAVQ